MNWVVYMVKCNDSSIYTGISNNLNRRLDTHAKGNGSKYVRARLPFKLIYTEKCLSRSKAIKRERTCWGSSKKSFSRYFKI